MSKFLILCLRLNGGHICPVFVNVPAPGAGRERQANEGAAAGGEKDRGPADGKVRPAFGEKTAFSSESPAPSLNGCFKSTLRTLEILQSPPGGKSTAREFPPREWAGEAQNSLHSTIRAGDGSLPAAGHPTLAAGVRVAGSRRRSGGSRHRHIGSGGR